jgi:hypothetical protein
MRNSPTNLRNQTNLKSNPNLKNQTSHKSLRNHKNLMRKSPTNLRNRSQRNPKSNQNGQTNLRPLIKAKRINKILVSIKDRPNQKSLMGKSDDPLYLSHITIKIIKLIQGRSSVSDTPPPLFCPPPPLLCADSYSLGPNTLRFS